MERDRLTALAAAVLADPELARRLCDAGAAGDVGRFTATLAQHATALGPTPSAEALATAALPDPLGIARLARPPLQGAAWPPPPWLPYRVVAEDRIYVDWACFGPAPLSEPFFEGSIRRVLHNPFVRLFRYRMTADDFVAAAADADALTPSGFIFHMSRCGSTLCAQMLAADTDNVVVSEAATIDAPVRFADGDRSADAHVPMLRAMITAYGRRRAGTERHFFVKLDSWHALALPLFRRAFPTAPWVFLYRNPIEVLVSQMRQRGIQMLPQMLSPRFFGLDDQHDVSDEDYCARVLCAICSAAADHAADGGRIVDYRDLPDALFATIMPHFGVTVSAAARAAMQQRATRDAKAPFQTFAADAAAKQRDASEPVRRAAARHLSEIHDRLSRLAGR